MVSLKKIRSRISTSNIPVAVAVCATLILPSCVTTRRKPTMTTAAAATERPSPHPDSNANPPPSNNAKKKSELTDKEKKALKNADLWIPE
jgi:hypothetical protein